MSRRVRLVLVLAALAVAVPALGALPATAVPPAQVFASFDSASTGELQGTPFTVGGCTSSSLGTDDLSGADFSPAGSTEQATLSCTTDAGMALTFAEPVADVDLYLVGLPIVNCSGATYTVTSDGTGPPTIASGFAGAVVEGSALVLPLDSTTSGVLHVEGPLTSLVLSPDLTGRTVTLTLGTSFVPPTTTTAAPTSTTTAGPGVAAAETTAVAVAPTFTC